MIELLVVVAVIGILMSLLFPAFAAVKTKGKQAQAKADVSSLKNACCRFEADYGTLPNVLSTGASVSVQAVDSSSFAKANSNTSAAYITLLGALSGYNYFSSTQCLTLNTRGSKYLNVPDCYANNAFRNPSSPCGFVDPWGNSYGIALDVEGSGQTSVSYPSGLKDSKGSSVSSAESVFSRVSIYSLGAGVQWKSDGKTLDSSNADAAVKSWK